MPTSTVFSSSAAVIPSSSGPPAGCQQADAAIAQFNKLDGPTWASKADAASAALVQFQQAINAAVESGDSAVYGDLNALYHDFGAMQNYALMHDGTDYNAALAQANTDIQALNGDCGAG